MKIDNLSMTSSMAVSDTLNKSSYIRYIKETVLAMASSLEETGRFALERECIQHGKTSVYGHSIKVAETSLLISNMFGLRVDQKQLLKGALLHDYFLYDWHDPENGHPLHGISHPQTALENASSDFGLTDLEKDIIAHHMFPLTLHSPKSKEAWVVCIADKICAFAETVNRYTAVHQERRQGRRRRESVWRTGHCPGGNHRDGKHCGVFCSGRFVLNTEAAL